MAVLEGGSQSPTQKKVGEIAIAYDLLMAKISALENNVNLLITKVEPVLAKDDSPEGDEVIKGNTIKSPFADALNEATKRLDRMIDATKSAVERVEL